MRPHGYPITQCALTVLALLVSAAATTAAAARALQIGARYAF